MLLIDKLVTDILNDEYFLKVFDKCTISSASNNFQSKSSVSLNQKEFIDSLRFSDILSNSKNSDARSKSYQIITALNSAYYKDPFYKTVSKSVFSRLGNFPAISFLTNKNSNYAILPLLNQVEMASKELIQQVPNSKDLYFTDSQYELFSRISNSTEFSFSGPTSMGKSFLIKSLIKKVLKNSPPENICVVVPTRALINQFSIDLKAELSELLEDYKYKIFTNSNFSELLTEEVFNYIFVLTPERLISYMSQNDNPPIGFLFIDEAHKLASNLDSRSITAYTAIEKVQKEYGNIKMYFSSPNVSNPEVFLKLFNRSDKNNSYSTNESPVTQNLYFVDLINREIELYSGQTILSLTENIDLKEIEDEVKFIVTVGQGKNNLIYCNSKRKTIEKAIEFSGNLSDVPVSTSIAKAIKNITKYIHPDYYLIDLLKKGVAFHYGKLPQLIRNLVEELYKEEEIQNIFCTSTLLEGVNMPTQNIFILDNKNGSRKLEPIDFWNLSGRAGRLAKELEGNIFCIQYEGFDWDNKAIFKKEKINLKPTVLNRIDRNLIKIEKILNSKNVSGSETEVEILKYISNIIKSDTLELDSNYKSPVINKLIEKNKERILELAQNKTKDYEIPHTILNFNQTIDFSIQNDVYLYLKKLKGEIKLPSSNDVNYSVCLKILEKFYDLYVWENAEKKLRNRNSLKYYAVLMNQWINGFTLSQIISQSIDWQQQSNGKIKITHDELVLFDRYNKKHINILIEKIIDDIEYVLRFLLEKYFNHYYQIVEKIKGKENAGENWATLLEYGTQNRIIIALQNVGISRNTATKIFKDHHSCLTIIEGKLSSINKKKLLQNIGRDSMEYDELIKVL